MSFRDGDEKEEIVLVFTSVSVTIWPALVLLNPPTDQELEIASPFERLFVIWFTTEKHVYVLDKQEIG